MEAPFLILSCEHASKKVPDEYRSCFQSKAAYNALNSHRGYDAGALDLALFLKTGLGVSTDRFFQGRFSRLLVDLNRSERHKSLFSEYSKALTVEAKETIVATIHRPYCAAIQSRVEIIVNRSTSIGATRAAPPSPSESLGLRSTVLHISVHSFTPVFADKVRRPDIALLYDPLREAEREFAATWIEAIKTVAATRGLTIITGRNDPYRGRADGRTMSLRRAFGEHQYSGIELEVNQRLLHKGIFPASVKDLVLRSLRSVLTASSALASSSTTGAAAEGGKRPQDGSSVRGR